MTGGGVRCTALLAAAALLASLPAGTAFSAANTVPGTKIWKSTPVAITADTLKPSACSAITLTTIVQGVTGTSGNDLLLATSAADTISAGGGNDCVLAGGGNDSINCGTGTDVAVGGPGTDTFNSNCETQIQ
jgi:Ca2+-binding RTX toxin-like protein